MRWIATSAGTASRRPIAILTAGEGETAGDPIAAVDAGYGRGETDEFVLPTAIGSYKGMADGDGLLLANFRADRIREIGGALLDPEFSGFKRPRAVKFSAALGFVEYSEELNRFLATLFPPADLTDTFGEIVAKAGMTQLRIAETEKYAHVTFFFNGGREAEFPGEDRILVPSPKVATYDKQPQMSAPEVTDKVVEAIKSGKFDVVVLNYANTDMVGHTGLIDAAVHAVETVDCVPRPARRGGRGGGRHAGHHRRSRQCRDDARSQDRRAAYRAHDQPGAVYRRQPAGGDRPAGERPTRRCRADAARAARLAAAGGDDRAFIDRRRRADARRRLIFSRCVLAAGSDPPFSSC